MLTERTAARLASTGRLVDVSLERSLQDVTTVATRGIPGCAGAAVAVWNGFHTSNVAASHPDLAWLLEWQCRWSEGPVLHARHSHESVFVADTLRDERWPRYAAAAVRVGVRSLLVLPREVDGTVITLAIQGAHPRTWEERDVLPMASLFAAQVAVILRNVGEYDTASGRSDGLTARAHG